MVTTQQWVALLSDPSLSYVDIALKVSRRLPTVLDKAYKLKLSSIRCTRPHKTLDHQGVQRLMDMRREGATTPMICRALGISDKSVRVYCTRYGIPKRTPRG